MSEIDSISDSDEPSAPDATSPSRQRSRPSARARRSKGRQWGLIAVAAVVVLIAGFLIFRAIGPKSSKTTYVTQPATTGMLTVAVSANGSVVTANSSAVDPGVSGTVTELNVSLGSPVKKGDTLFVIENADLDASVVQAKASYQSAQSSVAKAKQAKTQASVSKNTNVTQTKAQYQAAQASVEKADQAKIQAGIDLNTAIAGGDSAKIEMAQENYDAAVYSYKAAVNNQKTAKANYDSACAIAQQGYDAAVKSYNASVTSQQSAYLGYQNAKDNADKRTVVAPIDGYVTTLSIRNGDQLGSTSSSRSTSSGGGTTASTSNSSTTPIVISDLSALEAQVQIAETDRPKVKQGQTVELTFNAVSNLTITGKVAEIDAVGTNSAGVVTYGVTVTFDVQNPELNPGMTAVASIVTNVVSDAVLVPNAAVKTQTSGGGKYVQVLSDPTGQPQDVTVTVGASNDSQTQITNGLKGGESVVVQTVTPNSAGTGSSSTRSGMSVLGGGGGGGRPGGPGGPGGGD
jgi:multidrug efflux pump subunit AcrA (membrane-fusion protein)